MPVSDAIVKKFAEAIGHAEGFFAETRGGKPDLPQRCHNPGNLTDQKDIGYGTARSVGFGAADITVYADDAHGWAALEHKVRRMLDGASMQYPLWMSLGQIGMKYSCDVNWAPNVALRLGYPLTATLQRIADEKQTSRPGLG